MSGECYWIDAGTPQALLKAHFDLIDGARQIPLENVVDHGDHFEEPGVVLHGSATDHAFLGSGAIIEAGAVVRHSMIGAGVCVGAGAVIADSIVLAGATVEANATIEHSIVGPGGRIGEEARLSEYSVTGAGVAVAPASSLVGERLPV
jgi:mannose-1-phosphate guanylyltransferase